MAIQKPRLTDSAWANPHWPDRLTDANTKRLIYDNVADELVVLFDNERHQDPGFVWVSTPGFDYAAIKVDGASGEVIGIMVYPLAAFAVQRHPAWNAATEPNPSASVTVGIVRDIKNLFDRFGIDPIESDRN